MVKGPLGPARHPDTAAGDPRSNPAGYSGPGAHRRYRQAGRPIRYIPFFHDHHRLVLSGIRGSWWLIGIPEHAALSQVGPDGTTTGGRNLTINVKEYRFVKT